MSAPLTVARGYDAFERLIDVFTQAGDDNSRWSLAAFVVQLKIKYAPVIYEARAGAVPLHQASLGADEDDDMFFRIGSYGVDSLSARAIYRNGVLLLADRWADDLRLSLEADAPFDDVIEWPELSA